MLERSWASGVAEGMSSVCLSVFLSDSTDAQDSGVDEQKGRVGTVKERREEQTSTLYVDFSLISTDSVPSRGV